MGMGERIILNEKNGGDLNVDEDKENEEDKDDKPIKQKGGSDQSPIDNLKTFDWGKADDEMKEFLDSDEEDDDEDRDGGGGGDAEEEGEGGNRAAWPCQ